MEYFNVYIITGIHILLEKHYRLNTYINVLLDLTKYNQLHAYIIKHYIAV